MLIRSPRPVDEERVAERHAAGLQGSHTGESVSTRHLALDDGDVVAHIAPSSPEIEMADAAKPRARRWPHSLHVFPFERARTSPGAAAAQIAALNDPTGTWIARPWWKLWSKCCRGPRPRRAIRGRVAVEHVAVRDEVQRGQAVPREVVVRRRRSSALRPRAAGVLGGRECESRDLRCRRLLRSCFRTRGSQHRDLGAVSHPPAGRRWRRSARRNRRSC
jgi:hypothetical protein